MDAVELVLAKNDLSKEEDRLRGKLIGYNLQDQTNGKCEVVTLVDNSEEKEGSEQADAVRSAVSAHARFHRGRRVGGTTDDSVTS